MYRWYMIGEKKNYTCIIICINFAQGAEVVREDLIDDIAKESGPYQPPEKILRRSDMATDFSTPQQRIIKPNE